MTAKVRSGRRAAGVVGSVLGVLAASLAALGPAASASTLGTALANVPEDVRQTLITRAKACPEVPVAIQAAQLQVASGFDSDAVTEDGGRGIAAFTPRTWAVWGQDTDEDGYSGAFDVADSIDAQARRMCWLYGLARFSNLRGDRLSLALAGFYSGWPVVQSVGGVPASARAYVDEVIDLSGRAEVHGTPFGEGWGVPVGFPLPVPNPRKSSQAMAWARDMAGDWGWEQKCLNFTAQAYGWENSGTPYAIDHFWVVPAHLRHNGDRNAPPGSLVYWDTARRAGHVALSLGDGMIASNDILTPGRIDVVPASLIERKWGARYLGWTAPYYPEGYAD